MRACLALSFHYYLFHTWEPLSPLGPLYPLGPTGPGGPCNRKQNEPDYTSHVVKQCGLYSKVYLISGRKVCSAGFDGAFHVISY